MQIWKCFILRVCLCFVLRLTSSMRRSIFRVCKKIVQQINYARSIWSSSGPLHDCPVERVLRVSRLHGRIHGFESRHWLATVRVCSHGTPRTKLTQFQLSRVHKPRGGRAREGVAGNGGGYHKLGGVIFNMEGVVIARNPRGGAGKGREYTFYYRAFHSTIRSEGVLRLLLLKIISWTWNLSIV